MTFLLTTFLLPLWETQETHTKDLPLSLGDRLQLSHAAELLRLYVQQQAQTRHPSLIGDCAPVVSDPVMPIPPELHAVGMIDVGDARTGHPLFDLVAMHISLFRGSIILLRQFFESYNAEAQKKGCTFNAASAFGPAHSFPHRAMAMTLMHPCPALRMIFRDCPDTREVACWHEMERRVWGSPSDWLSLLG